jgi:hypothetical protein
MITSRAIKIPAPMPAPMPALAAVERPVWACDSVVVSLVEFGAPIALMDSAAATVDAEGFAFASTKITLVGWGP